MAIHKSIHTIMHFMNVILDYHRTYRRYKLCKCFNNFELQSCLWLKVFNKSIQSYACLLKFLHWQQQYMYMHIHQETLLTRIMGYIYLNELAVISIHKIVMLVWIWNVQNNETDTVISACCHKVSTPLQCATK